MKMPANLVLQAKFRLFQAVEQVVVGMGAMLFGIDLRMERGMFGCESFGMGLVHRSISFRWLTSDPHNKSRNETLVACRFDPPGAAEVRLAVVSIGG